ncbi:glycosyltransferase family 2 protein [Mycolicibacterium arenosum]|uniref:Glycosyltransferase n=1 Tax=Mycolicibacterium arenosum TaxID=2952157 RepID=A0ABT1M3A2_9MYCO|nr:glycosyltransferase [Mycolicibacterium sp. CAU 1645]MCP9273633.1 glycosyltransferase [Mycolicibacterium sp. CAU 1645]
MSDTTRAFPLTDGRFAVPGNRWDLLNDADFRPAPVAVVIPHYEQPGQLALVLRAIELQDFPADLVEVVVADDGSTVAPDVTASRLNVTVVRQEDRGFRAAAARNLGAAATTAEVLCFLDADTVPEPGYLRHLTRLPARLPDAVVVGRRRHADLSCWRPDMLEDWWFGATAPPVLAEPRWLRDAYDASADLLHIDQRSYRHVISAVMCCSRELFDDIGGFDESFRGYGGEDWEFTHRAVVGGAVLHHARQAVAWHDGPDWADRPVADRLAVKNREALALARLIPDPNARRSGLRYAVPAVVVELDTKEHDAASLTTTLGCFLHEDVGVWLHGARSADLLAELGVDDPRVRVGPVPDLVARRCHSTVVGTGRPALPAKSFTELLRRCGDDGVATVRVAGTGAGLVVCASWATNRLRRWTRGRVVFAKPADAQRIGEVLEVPADSVELRCVEPDVDLSW